MNRLADCRPRECDMKDDEIPVGLPLELKHFDPVAQVLVVVVLQVAVRKRRKLIFCWTNKVLK